MWKQLIKPTSRGLRKRSGRELRVRPDERRCANVKDHELVYCLRWKGVEAGGSAQLEIDLRSASP